MALIKKNIKHIIILLSIFFILQAGLLYYTKIHEYLFPSYEDLLLRYILVLSVYLLLFYQVYRTRKSKRVISIFLELLTLAAAISIFTVIPVIYARSIGIISDEIGYSYIIEVNILFALLLSFTVYATKYISYTLSKIFFIISINTVFIINCIAIAILYSTGFEIGPIVFLHFSWEAVKVGIGEYLTIFFCIIIALIPINIFLTKIIHNHKDSTINYTTASLVVIAVLTNSLIINFDLYKTKTILPIYSIIATAARYSNSKIIDLRKEYSAINIDERESNVLSELGININALTMPGEISKPSVKTNLITIYLESFQLDFTRHASKELYPGLTPNINSLPNDYVVYNNFINSVTPTINAMISSQCGVNITLSNKGNIAKNNEVLDHDAVAKDLLKDNLICLSDILHQSDYYQVMMKAAGMNFSGKGKFFLSHNYDLALDTRALNESGKYTDLNLWGLQDPMLIDEALNMLETLKDKQPFNLTFLTVNSHPPGYEYAGCPIYKEGNAMLNGIHCTDYALGKFLKKLEQMDIYKNTLVVIIGDHVLFRTITHKSLSSSWYGRTYLAIRTPDLSITQNKNVFGTTPDLAPTILDFLGFKNSSFISGQSLLGERRKHQRITASNFDIINSQMIPNNVESPINKCSISDASNEKIYNTEPYTDCQRAKIHYLQQKTIYQ